MSAMTDGRTFTFFGYLKGLFRKSEANGAAEEAPPIEPAPPPKSPTATTTKPSHAGRQMGSISSSSPTGTRVPTLNTTPPNYT